MKSPADQGKVSAGVGALLLMVIVSRIAACRESIVFLDLDTSQHVFSLEFTSEHFKFFLHNLPYKVRPENYGVKNHMVKGNSEGVWERNIINPPLNECPFIINRFGKRSIAFSGC